MAPGGSGIASRRRSGRSLTGTCCATGVTQSQRNERIGELRRRDVVTDGLKVHTKRLGRLGRVSQRWAWAWLILRRCRAVPCSPMLTGRGSPRCFPRTLVGGVDVSVITGRSSRESSTGTRTGVAWRDLPAEFGPWQTVWKRHRRFSSDGTWHMVLTQLLAHADAGGKIDWAVSIHSTINRTHQHAATLARTTVGFGESQESSRRAG